MAEHSLTDEQRKLLMDAFAAAGPAVIGARPPPGGWGSPAPGGIVLPLRSATIEGVVSLREAETQANFHRVVVEPGSWHVHELSPSRKDGPPRPEPFVVDDSIYRIAGTCYRIRPQADMTPRECYWLLRFETEFVAYGLDGEAYDQDSVLAWLAERNLLRHLEPASEERATAAAGSTAS